MKHTQTVPLPNRSARVEHSRRRFIECPLCGSEAKHRYRLAHTRAFECSNSSCSLQFANPQLDDSELARAYESLYYPVGDEPATLENASEFEVRNFLGAVERCTGSLRGKRVLDYGCGSGLLLRIAQEKGAETVGVEQSAIARKHINETYCRAYATPDELLAREGRIGFDCISMCDVVEHLRVPWMELSILRLLLAPGGRIFITTPNRDSLRSLVSGSNWDQRENPTHFFYFNSRSLSGALHRAGFQNVVELPAITNYSHHGPLRRLVQRGLARRGLQGGLLFMAGN